MKTKEELNALQNEVEALNKKLAELTDDEMKQVTGGMKIVVIKALQKPSNTSGEIQSSTTENIQSDWRTNTPGWNQWF